MITGYTALTRKLIRSNMKCYNYSLRYEESERTVMHPIFECLPILQVWSLSTTLSNSNIFLLPSIYVNIYYLSGEKIALLNQKSTAILIPR